LAGCLLLWHSRRMRCCSTSMLCMRTMLLAASAGVCVALNNSLGTTPQSACTASVHKYVVSGWQWHCQAGQPACLFARGRFSAHSLSACACPSGTSIAVGFNSWNQLGCNYDEAKIRAVADAMVSNGAVGLTNCTNICAGCRLHLTAIVAGLDTRARPLTRHTCMWLPQACVQQDIGRWSWTTAGWITHATQPIVPQAAQRLAGSSTCSDSRPAAKRWSTMCIRVGCCSVCIAPLA
jgi:hypothetical protein